MRIAVTGIGVISAIGRNCEQTVASLLEQRSGIGVMRHLNSAHTGYPVGEVDMSNDELRQMIGAGDEPLPRTSLLGIVAAREAMRMAGQTAGSAGQCAFVSGTTVGGMDLTERHWRKYQADEIISQAIRLHEAGAATNAIAAHLDAQFNFVATPSTACSSALNAIMLAVDMLRTGQVKYALAGGAESLSLFHFNGFRTLMILDNEPCRPFDATRTGLNLGEGAGYLFLENEEDALARGARILGYVGGYANACDAYHQTASSSDGQGAYLAMQGALTMAKLTPQDVDYVNTHGTATPNNDLSESAALKRVFGDSMPPVSSTKAFTGHTTSASGGIEAVICLLAMRHGFVPANLRWKRGDEGLVTPVANTLRRPLHNVLCNSFGFGGNESSLVLCDHPVDLHEAILSPLPEPVSRVSMPNADYLSASSSPASCQNVDVSAYLTASEARRLTPQMRQIVVAARKALHEAGIDLPDAIVCATRWGCMAQSMRFLTDMLNSDEQELKPTPFIQSTHNTVASLVAILTGNHGYNSTYSQVTASLCCALTDIRSQFALGRIKSALVLQFDEQVEQWDKALCIVGGKTSNVAIAEVYTASSGHRPQKNLSNS